MIIMHFGEFILHEKLVTQEQLDVALEYQRNYNRPMGKFAQSLGYINRRDNVRILLLQMKNGRRYGDIAVEMGYLTEEQVGNILAVQRGDNVMLGKILVQNGVLSRSQLLKALKDFIARNPPVIHKY